MDNEIGKMWQRQRPWRWNMLGAGEASLRSSGLRLSIGATDQQRYSDAQIDDYQAGAGETLLRTAPLRITLRACFSHPAGELRGTAGFGLWNYPSSWPPKLPRALWFFFASAPSNMALDSNVAGYGWKAASIDTGRLGALAWLPVAPLVVPLMHIPPLYRTIWPHVQRGVGVKEAALHKPMEAWHSYEICWGKRSSQLSVDGSVVLDNAPSPRGPLCFVAWLDNQYLIITPQGRIGWGYIATTERQWLEIADLQIEPYVE